MHDDFSLDSYDYELPQRNIAQHPSARRDASKLMVLNRRTGRKEHKHFTDILDYFNSGDLLVVNDTKVFPARLLGAKETGGKAEVFLLCFPKDEPESGEAGMRQARAEALVKSSRRPAVGSTIRLHDELTCTVQKYNTNGHVEIRLYYPRERDLTALLAACGSVPLPPYIERPSGTDDNDRQRYQTVYARNTGAVAAPTAGLHFTPELFEALRGRGVDIATLTLHVGYGTFAPVRSETITDHAIHQEYISIPGQTATLVNAAKKRNDKIWAVGTTTVRALEFAGNGDGEVAAMEGLCDLYIYPGYTFTIIDNLITNFHLPKSSLLFLVSALCGRERLLQSYREAIARDYRFYSYGDAMAIL